MGVARAETPRTTDAASATSKVEQWFMVIEPAPPPKNVKAAAIFWEPERRSVIIPQSPALRVLRKDSVTYQAKPYLQYPMGTPLRPGEFRHPSYGLPP